MSNDKPTPGEVIEQQTVIDPVKNTYTASCSICGWSVTQRKRLFHSHSAEMEKISRNFNFCRHCGKWVCEDCFFISDGNGNMLSICSACAKEQGVSGLTVTQFEEAWPQLQKTRQKRREAVQRAENKEQ